MSDMAEARIAAAARINTTVAHPARVYDYLLGGKDNFAADREMAEKLIELSPGTREGVHAHRAFLRRAVRYLAETGASQFLASGGCHPGGRPALRVGRTWTWTSGSAAFLGETAKTGRKPHRQLRAAQRLRRR